MNRLVWFRNDLRLKDNLALQEALNPSSDKQSQIFFVSILDPRWLESEDSLPARIGPFRKSFLYQSLQDLARELNIQGGALSILTGRPEDLLPRICIENNISEIYFSSAHAIEELQVEKQLEMTLEKSGVRSFKFENSTLIDPADYPKSNFLKYRSFSKFRADVEKSWIVRAPQPLTQNIERGSKIIDSIDFKKLLMVEPVFKNALINGGETAEQNRLKEYLWGKNRINIYKETRNNLIYFDDSSKFSPWLNIGNISAREIYAEVRKYEKECLQNSSTYWLLFELLWRDHFQFIGKALGSRLFGKVPKNFRTKNEQNLFESWCQGQTGQPFIDAGMTELTMTGWTSNRMRQNLASYLIHNLGVEWQWGARFFESYLIDYDPCSNWGNWAYIAGALPDNKPHIFDIHQQADRYDPSETYRNLWNNKNHL